MKFNNIYLTILSSLAINQVQSIIGGKQIEPFSRSFVVALQDSKDNLICTGSLLDSNTVITSAKCSNRQAKDSFVGVHRHDLNKPAKIEKGIKLEVRSIHINPKFGKEHGNEVAIWKLKKSIPKDIKVNYVTLDTKQLYNQTGLNAIAIGWGQYRENELGLSNVLREVVMPIYDINRCTRIYGELISKGNFICAGYKDEIKGICVGDFGGPLFYNKDGKIIQIGVTSFPGPTCAKSGLPSGYNSIASEIDFIKSIQKLN